MEQTVLRGRGREITRIPRSTWAEELAQAPAGIKARLDFMSEDHHKVRYHVVEQLPRHGRPLEPEAIADKLGLALPRVREILDELERKLFFLVRDEGGAVSWAFPVAAVETPHRLVFSTGERLNGA
jgi:hypothetical protein